MLTILTLSDLVVQRKRATQQQRPEVSKPSAKFEWGMTKPMLLEP